MPASLASCSYLTLHRLHSASLRPLADPLHYRLPTRAFWTSRDSCLSLPIRAWGQDEHLQERREATAPLHHALRCRSFATQRASRETQAAASSVGEGLEGGRPVQLLPLRRRLRAIRRVDVKLQRDVLMHGLGRPRCQRAQRLLKRGDANSVSARCPLFLQQLKPRLKLWKKALTPESLPPALYPEVAFAGRSNAGKSTLLNELCGRSGTAFVSRRPGSTQELYFFKAGSPCCLCLVDLPGYGYAEAEASKRLQWTEMCLLYLKTRPNLKRVFLLVDSRWGLKASDLCLLSFFERHRVPFQLVLTKADLPEQKSLVKVLQIVSEDVKKFKGCVGPPIAVSALRHRGLDPLRSEIDKLRMTKEAANLVEARRLKKEARAAAKAQRGSKADGPQAAKSQMEGERPGEGQGTEEGTDIVTRALQRWGSSLTQGQHSETSTPHDPESGLQARVGADSDEADGGGASAAGSFFSIWAEGRVAGGHEGQQEERREEQWGSMRLSFGETGEGTVSAAAALESALDSAAKAVPLPQSPNLETLIRDLLPSSPSSENHQVHEGGDTSESALSSQLEERETQAVRARVRSHSKQNLMGDMPDKTAAFEVTCSPDEGEELWGNNSAFYEFNLDQQTRSKGECLSSATSTRVKPQEESLALHPEIGGDAVLSVTSEACSPSPTTDKPRVVENASAGEAVHAKLDLLNEDSPAGMTRGRSLEALRLEDWRARRVSRTAVEIDMRLSRDKVAAAGATLYLSMNPPTSSSSSSSSSSRSKESSAGKQANAEEKLHHPRHALPDLKRVYPEGGRFVDEDTLAAEQLQGNRRRGSRASSSAESFGTLEIDMQRGFNQKWRRELLPIEDSHDSVKNKEEGKVAFSGKQGISSANLRKEASDPFRIPPDFITTREDSSKSRVTSRLSFELRLQRAQEKLPSTWHERDRSSAESLLFSAAQRRQERRLKELTMKKGKTSARTKEMTWDVAYRRWARWAKAHPTLAR
ncbi:hypothetical protein Emed_000980 [Eimeria media]